MTCTWYEWIGGGLLALVVFYLACRLATLAYFISKRQVGANNRRKDT
jgi:membrane-anchored glycerophosphoryl diester phosphodiesterase (GDPDase)